MAKGVRVLLGTLPRQRLRKETVQLLVDLGIAAEAAPGTPQEFKLPAVESQQNMMEADAEAGGWGLSAERVLLEAEQTEDVMIEEKVAGVQSSALAAAQAAAKGPAAFDPSAVEPVGGGAGAVGIDTEALEGAIEVFINDDEDENADGDGDDDVEVEEKGPVRRAGQRRESVGASQRSTGVRPARNPGEKPPRSKTRTKFDPKDVAEGACARTPPAGLFSNDFFARSAGADSSFDGKPIKLGKLALMDQDMVRKVLEKNDNLAQMVRALRARASVDWLTDVCAAAGANETHGTRRQPQGQADRASPARCAVAEGQVDLPGRSDGQLPGSRTANPSGSRSGSRSAGSSWRRRQWWPTLRSPPCSASTPSPRGRRTSSC